MHVNGGMIGMWKQGGWHGQNRETRWEIAGASSQHPELQWPPRIMLTEVALSNELETNMAVEY